jgi:hypothetical protein
VKCGLNTSTITNLSGTVNSELVTKIGTERVSGLNMGLGFEYNPVKKWGIETGLYYSEYGTKYHTEGHRTEDYTVEIVHIQIPLLAKYYIYKGFNVFAGPQIGYRLASDTKPSNFYNLYGKKLYYSGVAGLGYQFNFGLQLSANYIHGFTDLDPSYESYSIINQQTVLNKYESMNRRISAFQFNLGWRF